MLAEPLPIVTTMEIRTHIDNLKEKVKAASRKVVDDKKRLLKVQKMLTETTKEIDHIQAEIW